MNTNLERNALTYSMGAKILMGLEMAILITVVFTLFIYVQFGSNELLSGKFKNFLIFSTILFFIIGYFARSFVVYRFYKPSQEALLKYKKQRSQQLKQQIKYYTEQIQQKEKELHELITE